MKQIESKLLFSTPAVQPSAEVLIFYLYLCKWARHLMNTFEESHEQTQTSQVQTYTNTNSEIIASHSTMLLGRSLLKIHLFSQTLAGIWP